MSGNPGVPLLVVGGLFGLIGLCVTAANWSNFKRRRRIMSTPTTPIARAPGQGPVEVNGRVHPSEQGLAIAPFSGRQGVIVRVVVEEYRSRGKSGSWITIVNELDARSFFIEDGSGEYARVLPANANIVLDRTTVGTSGTFNDAAPQLEHFLRSRGLQSTSLLGFNKSMRYHEEVILVGNPLYAIGPSRRDPAPPTNDAYRNGPATQLVLFAMSKAGDGELIVTNKTEAQLVSKLLWGFVTGVVLFGIGALAIFAGVVAEIAMAF